MGTTSLAICRKGKQRGRRGGVAGQIPRAASQLKPLRLQGPPLSLTQT